MKNYLIFLLFFLVVDGIVAQSKASHDKLLVDKGNSLYKDEQFVEAEELYRKALENNQTNLKATFNLGNSLFKQNNRFEEAINFFQQSADMASDSTIKYKAYHNLGNANLLAGKFQESVEAYKNALRIFPSDMETKYNLAYAQLKLKQQQQEQQQNQQNQEQKDKEKNQENEQKEQENEQKEQEQEQEQKEQNQDKKDKEEQEKSQNQQENKESPQEGKEEEMKVMQLSKEEALKLLKIMEEQEQEVQKRLKLTDDAPTKSEEDW